MPFVAIDHIIAFAIDAAIKASHIQQLDQNIDDHEARIAAGEAGGFPVGDGSVTPAKMSTEAVGEYVAHMNSIERSTAVVTYTKLKEIKINLTGTLRIKFQMKASVGTAYGKIYKNGSAVGTERSSATTSYITYSEDIASLVPGDLIQIYARGDSTSTAFIQRLAICTNNPHVAGGEYGY